MDIRRPNPDHLLERVVAEERKRGRLKIYLGMAAGAGKTFAMLTDALVEKRRGIDVVSGYIEPHGRAETETLAVQLEQLPFRPVEHHGVTVREFDLDAALKRHPQILLVDELAHSNAIGLRHAKRWQDIDECLAQGIHVYTTLNVQHIDSLTDIVTKIIGIAVHETVPDTVVRSADEIELIDITPADLIQRLKDGKVYLTEKVDSALENFFKPGNLLALRELVLRVTAERVDEQLITHRRLHGVEAVWPSKPRLLVCVSPNYPAEQLVRTAWRLASSMHTELVALTVEDVSRPSQWEAPDGRVRSGLQLAESLGAIVVRSAAEDIVSEVLRVAREKNVNILVVGKSLRSRIWEYWFGSVVDDLIRQSGDLDVYVITSQAKVSHASFSRNLGSLTWRGLLTACALTAVTTLFCLGVAPYLDLSNLIMFYLLAVAWAGSKLGRAESVLTSVLSVLAFDFCFVPPRWTLAVHDVQYAVTFVVMLIIALLISTLTMQLKAQAQQVNRRERRTHLLYEMSKRLASASTLPQVAAIVREKSADLFGSEGVLFLPNEHRTLDVPEGTVHKQESEQNELAVARWVSLNNQAAGKGTDTLSGAKGRYIPIPATGRVSAVLGVYFLTGASQYLDDPLLEAFATQVGSALERVFAEMESTGVQLQIERERVRNLLLSSISHDFRSPLATISGAADTLVQRKLPIGLEGHELIGSIRDESNRLSRLVRNVLDLTRLEAGEIQLKIEWESIEELLGTALKRTTLLLGERKVRIETPLKLPLVQVDAPLIEQVFVNLFENIARHTPDGTPVAVSASALEKHLLIVFSDSGPGLVPGTEKQIFEKSFRGEKSREGFGLGLTICQAVIAAHRGEISASNNPDGGARFELLLPLPDRQPEVLDGG